MNSEWIIVGAGFFGATAAVRLAEAGRNVLVLEKRPHIGGNCYSEVDAATGIECHQYGSHIFHTSNEAVWTFLSAFTSFNQYRHTVWTTHRDRVYSMPINLHTINAFYGANLRPSEVDVFIAKECEREGITTPRNLEEKAITLMGRPLYEAFVKGYTIKQWDKDPTELSPDIITRLPIRRNYSNRYFSDRYEGIPCDGYTRVFERMLDHPNIDVRLNVDYFDVQQDMGDTPLIYTGPLDRFFSYRHGRLEWRSIAFEKHIHDVEDYQGCSVMNYADAEVPYTRIHEFKHFHPERPKTQGTITFTEFSRVGGATDNPYYPVNTPHNRKLLRAYENEASRLSNIWFGGRLGSYRYLDMDTTVAAALELTNRLLSSAGES